MKRFLVTGGAGFIGSHLVEGLVKQGGSVRVLDDFSTGRRENLALCHGQIDLIEGSILDPSATTSALLGCEVVYHLAALPSVTRSVENPRQSHEVCATGTLAMLEAARDAGVKRFIYAASSSAYGAALRPLRRETDAVEPLSPYAVAKLAGEEYCRLYPQLYGLATLRLRFFNVYGPRQRGDSLYAGVIPKFIRQLREGETPLIWGDGLQSRDFTFVGDIVQGLLLAGERGTATGQVLNLGTGTSTTICELLSVLGNLMGVEPVPRFMPARSGEVRHSVADCRQAEAELGYQAQVQLPEGLRVTLEAAASLATARTRPQC